MQRVTEPELMLELEQVRVYAAADFSVSEQKMISRLISLVEQSGKIIDRKSLVLDLGCGPGNITERIASLWPETRVIGIDASSNMLRVANERQKLKNDDYLSNRISYINSNISSLSKIELDFLESADVVVSNSLIHHIHDFKNFLNALEIVSKKGTLHFHRDLRRPSSLREAISLQKKHLPNAPKIMVRDFMASLKAAYTSKEILYYLENTKFKDFEVVEVDDRYIDIFGIA